MEGNTLTTMIDSLGTVFTAILGHISTIGETIVSTPIMFLPFAVSIVGSLIFMAKRFVVRH